MNVIERPQEKQNNKWQNGENKQGKNYYINIPLVRNDIAQCV